MFGSIEARVAGLGDALAGVLDVLDPDAGSAASAEQLWSGFDRLERLASAGKTLLARRAAQGPEPASGDGARYRSGVERLAARAGCGVGAAREAVETSKRLAGGAAAGVAAALKRGELSSPQAAAVSAAVEADPSAEERLVDLAARVSLPELREECARVRAAADPDPAARNSRLHRTRRLRRFTDAEGAWQLLARGTPQAGAAFNAVLEPLIDQVFRAARREGRHEPVEAYAFDALMAMADLAAGDTQPGAVRPSAGAPGSATGTGRGGGVAAPGRGGPDASGGEVAASGPCGDAGTDRSDVPGTGSDCDAADVDAIATSDGYGRPATAPTRTQPVAPWWAAAQGVPLGEPGPDDDRDHCHPPSASAAPWWATAHLLGAPPAHAGSCAHEGERGTDGPLSRRLIVPGTAPPAAPPDREVPPPTRSPAVGRAGGRPVLRNPRHLALVRVDLTALHRGSVAGDEMCEIAGVGPVPVDVARGLLGDAVLKLVITRGVDVLNVTHLGRGPTAAQRVALAWQSPTCAAEGCWRRRVEIDHREEWARTRHTRLDELDPLCALHHDLKTRLGWALAPGTGKRPFVPLSDARHPRHQRRHHGGPAGTAPGPGDAAGQDAPGPHDGPTPRDAPGSSGRPGDWPGQHHPPGTAGAVAQDVVGGQGAGAVPPSHRPGQVLVEDAATASASGTEPPPGEHGVARAVTPVSRRPRGHRRQTVTAEFFEDGLP